MIGISAPAVTATVRFGSTKEVDGAAYQRSKPKSPLKRTPDQDFSAISWVSIAVCETGFGQARTLVPFDYLSHSGEHSFMTPETHFAENNGVSIAYQVFGDGPARAILCAETIRDSTRQLGLDLRIGIHTGECEIGEDSLEGITIHIAARVSAIADGGEIVVSRTVNDIVSGSGIKFEDIGTHTLKGIPDEYQLFKLSSA